VFVSILLLSTAQGAFAQDQPAEKDTLQLSALYQALDQGSLAGIDAGRIAKAPPAQRVLAVQVLASSPHPESLPLLTSLFKDPAVPVQAAVMVAAGRIGAPAESLVMAGIKSPQPEVRRAAAWAASHAQGKLLLALIAGEQDTSVLEIALANLWRLPEGIWEEVAAGFATNPQQALRRAAAYSLARGGDDTRLAALRTLGQDSDPVVRAFAAGGWRRGTPGKAELAALLAGLDDPDQRVRVAACTALAAQPKVTVPEAAAATIAALWHSPDPHLAAAALAAARSHAGIGSESALQELIHGHDRWLADLALQVLAARKAEAAARIAAEWLAGSELWQRRAAARIAGDNEGLVKKVLADQEAAVRLAWLEALSPEGGAKHQERLWQVVRSDADPAVRSQALDLLADAGAIPSLASALELHQAWSGDAMADARASALLAGLKLAASDQERQTVLDRAAADRAPAVAAMVSGAARRAGHKVAPAVRSPRHDPDWYQALVAWAAQEHWLDVVTVRGTFRLHLESQAAPITSREIFELAEAGFYDGLSFHRVVPNFVVQGGDPRGDGWGGPGFVLPDEPSLIPYRPWRVGIATSGANTGGCQLFVTTMDTDHLTGHYTNFAEVTAGHEVVTRLRVGDAIRRIVAHSGSEPPLPAPTLLGTLEWHQLAGLDGWQDEKDLYLPDPAAIAQLQTAAGIYQVVTVLGTWCGDSQREVPRMVQVIEEIGTPAFRHWMIGVDRSKRVNEPEFPEQLFEQRCAERVPTIIVLDELGEELGRVVETAEIPLESFLVETVAPLEGW
jgi:cyclophilin family peptidyl-prolyl cis-trans isomerase